MASGTIVVRVAPELRAAVEREAAANTRTLSQEVRRTLAREYVTGAEAGGVGGGRPSAPGMPGEIHFDERRTACAVSDKTNH
jgi:hypothetical protein